MAGLIYDLIKVLEEETLCYRNLLEMSKEKTDILVAGDTAALQELTKKEQAVVSKTARLEKNREQVIEDIALVLNEDKKSLTISKLLERLKNSGEESQRLKKVQLEMQNVLDDLKRSNEQNRLLLNQSMEMIDFTINAIQSKRTFTTNDYSQGGQMHSANSRSFFDARQ
ncbi:flagellar protein FlgN [Defluviitalea saccharophila]|uniref:Flagellar protein FlgN n=1 Tax=Defluviitalea saccharophila TaxID=879970 RepID=A0ABZ2Y0C5_9FIRM